MKSSITMAKE